MEITTLGARDLAIIMAAATIMLGVTIAAIAAWVSRQRRRSERLRTQPEGSEYDSAVKADGRWAQAKARLNKRNTPVESLNNQTITDDDRGEAKLAHVKTAA